jgi:hypothetical protein
MMTQQELINALEPILDRSTLSDVVFALARLCNEKAEHLLINWQDDASAKAWDKAAGRIDKLAEKLMVTP